MTEELTAQEISNRIRRFQKVLVEQSLDGALMLQKVGLYYLSGTDQDGCLWVPAEGNPLLMIRKSMMRAEEDSPLEAIVPLSDYSLLPQLIAKYSGSPPGRFGLEMDVVPAKFYLAYQKLFPKAEIVDVAPLIRRVRMVKSNYEISCIAKAAAMADRMYEQLPTFLKEFNTETELASRVEWFYRCHGHPGFIRTRSFNMECFYGHIMAGENAAAPSNSPGPTGGRGMGAFCSQGPGNQAIKPHTPVLVDYAANCAGYISDQTRIFSIGELSGRIRRHHDFMLEIQGALIRRAKPGVRAEDLYNLALERVNEAGLAGGFMGYPEPVPFVGHGVGLEMDEWPIIGCNQETVLEEGMVIALEPKLVFQGEGTVGIENTFVVKAEGLRKLNKFPDRIVSL